MQNEGSTKKQKNRYHLELNKRQGEAFQKLADDAGVTLSVMIRMLLQDKYLSCMAGMNPVFIVDFEDPD